ncbi:MAG: MFS transporter [Lapillicoccus sp.]
MPPAVWALVAARAVNRVGAFTLPFLAVVLAQEFALPVTTAGWLLALFGVATVPSRLAGGVLADRLGRVPTICLGLVGCAAAQLLIAASLTLAGAVVGVVLLGLAFELYEPPSQALVADLTDERSRPVAYGLLSAALAGAGAVAGLLAASLAGVGLRWLLVADAASCLVCVVVVVAVVRPHLRRSVAMSAEVVTPAATFPDAAGGGGPWRDRRLLALLAAGTVFALLSTCVVMTLPLTLEARGFPASDAGLLFTVSAVTVVVGQPLLRWGPLSGRAGFGALAIGYAVLAAGLAATGVATTVLGFVAATVLWSVGDLVLLGHSWSLVSQLAPAKERGRYLAAYGLSWGVATIGAPVIGTQLLARGGPVLLWSALAVVALGLAAVQPLFSRSWSTLLSPGSAPHQHTSSAQPCHATGTPQSPAGPWSSWNH